MFQHTRRFGRERRSGRIARKKKSSDAMILGIGLDLVELERIRRSLTRFGRRLTEKILHETERVELGPREGEQPALALVRHTAARFAAKEAAAKALGTGFSAGVGLHDIRVYSLDSGKPEISLHGAALERARTLGAQRTHLSISHTDKTAAAVVILEQVTNETSEPLCKDLRANPCRETGAGGLCTP
jgi:holo-[acyl-carrier protein] synthase